MLENSKSGSTFNRSNSDMSITDLLDVAWRRRWLVCGCMVFSVVLGALYFLCADSTYKVAARVLVQPQEGPLHDGTSARSEKEFLSTQSQIISSPAVIERAVAAMKPPLAVEPGLDPVLEVLSNLKTKPITGTNVLSLEYRCKNPSEGIRMVEAVLESYQNFLHEMSDDSRLESLRLLTCSEEKLRDELENREKRYQELRKNSPLIGQGKDATILQTTMLENLGQTLSEIRSRRIDLQSRMELLRQSTEAGLNARAPLQEVTTVSFTVSVDGEEQQGEAEAANPSTNVLKPVLPLTYRVSPQYFPRNLFADSDLMGTPDATTINQELHQAQMQQKKLAQVCGPKHPEMLALQQQIVELKNQLHLLSVQAPITFQNEIEAIQAHEGQLAELYQQELGKAKANDDYLVKESQELDGIERLKTIHNSLVVQLSDWRLVDTKEDGAWGLRMEVLEAPTIGTGPIWPKKSVLLILCSAIGLLGGLGMIVVLERDTWASTQHVNSTDA